MTHHVFADLTRSGNPDYRVQPSRQISTVMPKKKKSHPLYEHRIIVPILKVTYAINARRRGLPKGAPLPVTGQEEQLLRASSALMRLIAHTAKLEHAIHFLGQEGRGGKTGGAALQLLGPSGWVEYHLGYFYTLHRSTYESAQWFTGEALNMKLPKHMGQEKKFNAGIAKSEMLVRTFEGLKAVCDAFAEPRNDHIHRGQYVRSGPVTGRDQLDQLLVANSMFNMSKKPASARYDAALHKELREMMQMERLVLIGFLKEEVDKIHVALVRLIDILEPVLRKQISDAEENKAPA